MNFLFKDTTVHVYSALHNPHIPSPHHVSIVGGYVMLILHNCRNKKDTDQRTNF
jgi:hypothetical protein